MTPCPCGSSREFHACCEPIIAGAPAPTAEALMRSRYTAFAKRTLDHVDRTHAPEVRADFNRAEAERTAEECEWKGLEIRKITEAGDLCHIEFVVQFRREHQNVVCAAVSHFRRDNGQWLFVSSSQMSQVPQRRGTKIGRNSPCPCNSGKKVKRCCGEMAESK